VIVPDSRTERIIRSVEVHDRTLNGELAGIFKRWYPGLDVKADEIPLAA